MKTPWLVKMCASTSFFATAIEYTHSVESPAIIWEEYRRWSCSVILDCFDTLKMLSLVAFTMIVESRVLNNTTVISCKLFNLEHITNLDGWHFLIHFQWKFKIVFIYFYINIVLWKQLFSFLLRSFILSFWRRDQSLLPFVNRKRC